MTEGFYFPTFDDLVRAINKLLDRMIERKYHELSDENKVTLKGLISIILLYVWLKAKQELPDNSAVDFCIALTKDLILLVRDEMKEKGIIK